MDESDYSKCSLIHIPNVVTCIDIPISVYGKNGYYHYYYYYYNYHHN